MKRFLVLVPIFLIAVSIISSQDSGQSENQNSTESPVMQFDEAVSVLANNIHAKLTEKRAGKITIGQFVFRDNVPPFSVYWGNHLVGELTNMRGRNYTIYSSGSAEADWTITGEIVQVADVIRIYTTITHTSDRVRTIEASFNSSFKRDGYINEMLSLSTSSSGGSSSSSSSSAPVGRDSREPDSWESPVRFTIGSNQNVPVMNRTITAGDEDFFLLVPDRDGRLTAETTGSLDTCMDLFNYDNEEELASNDDGGQDTNARIVYNVRSGTSYLAVVRGYSSTITGSYGFRAYLTVREGGSSWEAPISYEIGADEKNIVTVNRSLQEGDEDYFLLVPVKSGRIVIETTGRTDTFMEIYDADDRDDVLDENDDGGNNYNARIRYVVEQGIRYIVKVRGFGASDTGNYGFRAYYPGSGMMPADNNEPNDEPSKATPVTVGSTIENTFHSAEDIDWFKFSVTQAGRYNINTRGVNSNRLDTYIALYDSNLNPIAEDDDGGNALSSLISQNLNRGSYYLKVWCLDEEPDQGYTLTITAE